jgi:deoxyinosine 3'endonuclease (endonuclease V)
MRSGITHEWDIGIVQAREIQEKLREKVGRRNEFGEIRTVAGLDAAFVQRTRNWVCGFRMCRDF